MATYNLKLFKLDDMKNPIDGEVWYIFSKSDQSVVEDGLFTIKNKSNSVTLKGTGHWLESNTANSRYNVTLSDKERSTGDIDSVYLSLLVSFSKVTKDPKSPRDARWGIAGQALIKMPNDPEAVQYLVIGTDKKSADDLDSEEYEDSKEV